MLQTSNGWDRASSTLALTNSKRARTGASFENPCTKRDPSLSRNWILVELAVSLGSSCSTGCILSKTDTSSAAGAVSVSQIDGQVSYSYHMTLCPKSKEPIALYSIMHACMCLPSGSDVDDAGVS